MQVIWSDKAKKDFLQILDYLEEDWGVEQVKKFTELTETLIAHIERNPKMFPSAYSKKKNIRRVVITKHNRLYYRIGKHEITLLSIFAVRQHPKKVKLK
jgi:plasmid stabilization system protein ParE